VLFITTLNIVSTFKGATSVSQCTKVSSRSKTRVERGRTRNLEERTRGGGGLEEEILLSSSLFFSFPPPPTVINNLGRGSKIRGWGRDSTEGMEDIKQYGFCSFKVSSGMSNVITGGGEKARLWIMSEEEDALVVVVVNERVLGLVEEQEAAV
jgi:hypothetical protein